MTPNCINLRQAYGKDFRIGIDPAYDARGLHLDKLDPWCFVLPCRFGCIWPYGGSMLAVDIDYHGRIAKKVAELPGVRVLCDGHREKTYLFHVWMFDQVAALVLPQRRRKMSDEQKKVCIDRLKRFQY